MNTLITNDRLDTFRRNAHLIPDGAIVEVGVYKGGSLKLLTELFTDRKVYGFDTFEGLPFEQWNENEPHKPEEFNDTSLAEVQKFVPDAILVQGLFPDSAPEIKHIALAHVDTDFYLSTLASLQWILPRLVKGGIVVIDDYDWPNCPGVKQALNELKLRFTVSADYQAIYIKQ